MRFAHFVFRHRFWAFALVFWIGFSFAAIDHVPTAVRLAHAFARGGVASTTTVRAIFWIGAAFVVAAALLRSWATAYLRSSVVHDRALHSDAIVADGPYRFTRNPLYLGGLLMAIGLAPVAPLAGAVTIVVGVTAVVLSLIAVEEHELDASIPGTFAAYRAAVPRFLPTLRPALPAGGAHPSWPQALAGESFFWAFALASIVWAATLDLRWMVGLIAAGMAASVAVRRWAPNATSLA